MATALTAPLSSDTAADQPQQVRFISAVLLAGALLLIAGNVAHPLDAAMSATSRLPLAAGDSWVVIHLLLATGFACVAAGIVLLAARFTGTRGSGLARVSAVMAAIGGTLMFAVFAGLDGFAQHSLAPAWAAAPDSQRALLEATAIALEAVDTGLAAAGTLALFGFGFLALGAALTVSGVLGRWFGPLALAIGVLGTVVGVVMVSQGATELSINGLMRPLGMASTLYVIALAVALRRSSAHADVVN